MTGEPVFTLAHSLAQPLAIRDAVRSVRDPELGDVTIGELGLVVAVEVGDHGDVEVALVPTFLGCPALAFIASDVEAAARLAGARSVTVTWRTDLAWTSDRVDPTGRAKLAALGIAVGSGAGHGQPHRPLGSADHADHPDCPDCPDCRRSTLTLVDEVGPTACRAVAWCHECRSPVEILRDAAQRVG